MNERRWLLLKKGLALSCLPLLLSITPAQAVRKPPVASTIKVSIAPNLATNFSAGDEVSQILTSPSGIYLIGTLETTSSPLVTGAPLGGSDGFITSLNSSGGRNWDLRLGTTGDDVATAGYIDATGNIWVTGASVVGVDATNGGSKAQGLNRFTVWEVSSSGLLLNTFTKDLSEVDIPSSITLKGTNFTIEGISSKVGFPTFSLTLSPSGNISLPKASTKPFAASLQIFDAVSSAYDWKSFVASKMIQGVSGVSLHPRSNLLLKLSLKNKSVKGAYSLPGVPIEMHYQVGVGVVVLCEGGGSYFLSILHTK